MPTGYGIHWTAVTLRPLPRPLLRTCARTLTTPCTKRRAGGSGEGRHQEPSAPAVRTAGHPATAVHSRCPDCALIGKSSAIVRLEFAAETHMMNWWPCVPPATSRRRGSSDARGSLRTPLEADVDTVAPRIAGLPVSALTGLRARRQAGAALAGASHPAIGGQGDDRVEPWLVGPRRALHNGPRPTARCRGASSVPPATLPRGILGETACPGRGAAGRGTVVRGPGTGRPGHRGPASSVHPRTGLRLDARAARRRGRGASRAHRPRPGRPAPGRRPHAVPTRRRRPFAGRAAWWIPAPALPRQRADSSAPGFPLALPFTPHRTPRGHV